MGAETLSILAVGIAVVGLNWRIVNSLRQDMTGRLDRIEARLNEMDRRLATVEGKMDMLLTGLHIEIKGGNKP